ncbi:hypothetical protein OPV22_004630 [Ensete ventricosum]|uniref:Uncharacterized protein n=1 Tax=Ensete ventricosum TaxID=4639 RepID=A0AAV8RKE9_ENSVE|nr:hypothetical protein OPV22_004630 [Ensete ventricosum]
MDSPTSTSSGDPLCPATVLESVNNFSDDRFVLWPLGLLRQQVHSGEKRKRINFPHGSKYLYEERLWKADSDPPSASIQHYMLMIQECERIDSTTAGLLARWESRGGAPRRTQKRRGVIDYEQLCQIRSHRMAADGFARPVGIARWSATSNTKATWCD